MLFWKQMVFCTSIGSKNSFSSNKDCYKKLFDWKDTFSFDLYSKCFILSSKKVLNKVIGLVVLFPLAEIKFGLVCSKRFYFLCCKICS